MRDVYRRDGSKTGRILANKNEMQPGDYFRHAIVILKASDGRYIMQQRGFKTKYYPGQWDVTGGGVEAGETSDIAGAREVYEELGLCVDPKDMTFMLTEVSDWGNDRGLIIDTWFVKVEIPDEGFRLQAEEVNDVRLVDAKQFIDTVCYNKTEQYRAMLERTVEM